MSPSTATRITHPLADGCPPPWASEWGQDRYGPWVEFEVQSADKTWVSQRLRWIPPGGFTMGSPETEPGRYDNEGPQHRVVIPKGFWMFETPCPQGLWTAVMPENPSYFQDSLRPVESVSFEDVVRFLAAINQQVPGLSLELPREAQWEYACRAGTTTSTYAGNVEIVGACNAPGLDAIAWYGGNSGHEYDLATGYDSSRWPEKQYPHTKAGTRRVGLKAPNPWGLYDMLGNVWEWCLDHKRKYTNELFIDQFLPTDAGADRVVRGGSWGYDARGVRAAYRLASPPDYRSLNIGFRCLSSGGMGE